VEVFLSEQAEGNRRHEVRSVYAAFKYAAENRAPKNLTRCKPLGDGIYEVKVSSRSQIRVIFFRDGGDLVCTEGVIKKQDSLPTGTVPTAKRLKKDYFKAKRAGTLTWVEKE